MDKIYLDKIKKFSKIKITEICKRLNINRSNLLNGKSTVENEKQVYEEIVKMLDEIR